MDEVSNLDKRCNHRSNNDDNAVFTGVNCVLRLIAMSCADASEPTSELCWEGKGQSVAIYLFTSFARFAFAGEILCVSA